MVNKLDPVFINKRKNQDNYREGKDDFIVWVFCHAYRSGTVVFFLLNQF
jgi:hypothetical protein